MLARRLRRRPNIGPTLCRCVVFSGVTRVNEATSRTSSVTNLDWARGQPSQI